MGVGLGVLAELMDEEVDEVVGPKGRHDPDRTAVRHGREVGEVTLGGRRVPVERPRVRAADGSGEVPLRTYRHFADRDPLTGVVLGADARRRLHAQVLAHARAGRPGRRPRPSARRSKSAVSREFVGRTREHLRGADEPRAWTTCAWRR